MYQIIMPYSTYVRTQIHNFNMCSYTFIDVYQHIIAQPSLFFHFLLTTHLKAVTLHCQKKRTSRFFKMTTEKEHIG